MSEETTETKTKKTFDAPDKPDKKVTVQEKTKTIEELEKETE